MISTKNILLLILCVLAFALAAYTQLTHLTSVPGLHFDEAWQGLFAHKLATQTDSAIQLSAMNSYTSPVHHYILAIAFKKFGSTLLTMRGLFAGINLLSLLLISGLLWFLGERRAVVWFILTWALLPLSVHDHRFYVEVTCFFEICFAVLLWGLALWYRVPLLSAVLIWLSVTAGCYSHILFVSVFFAGIYALARSYPREFRSGRSSAVIALTALTLTPLSIRMGLGLHKALPFVMAAFLLMTAFWAAVMPAWIRFQTSWTRFPRRAMRLSSFVLIGSLPFLIPYIFLLWNGFWTYAQVTGYLQLLWFPINALIFLMLMLFQLLKKSRSVMHEYTAQVQEQPRVRFLLSPSVTWGAFVAVFACTSLIILKQTARYYMVPTILAMMWSAQRLGRIKNSYIQSVIAIFFIGCNFWAFQHSYIDRFEKAGPVNDDFQLWKFHESARDFRPFQKAFDWAVSQNCQNELKWVEDDRFLRSVEFLQLTAPQPSGKCPWESNNFFFSHIPNYDPNFLGERNELNTAPPYPNVKYLKHEPAWGDLAFWLRRW